MSHLPTLTTFDGRHIVHFHAGRVDPSIGLIADVTTVEGYILRDQPLDMLARVNRRRDIDAARRRHPAGRAIGGVVGLVYSPAAVSEIRREHLKDAKEATAQVHALLALSAATQGGPPMTDHRADHTLGETPSPRPDAPITAADLDVFANILGCGPEPIADLFAAARREDARRAADYHDAHTAGELIDAISAELAEGSMPATLRAVLVELLARLGARLDAIATVRDVIAVEADNSPSRQVAAILRIHVENLDSALRGDQ